jgi:hypothetical protein
VLTITDFNFFDGVTGTVIAAGEKDNVCKLVLKKTNSILCATEERIDYFHNNLICSIKLFANLTSLEVVGYNQLSDKHVADLGVVLMSQIRELCFEGCGFLTSATFQFVNQHCPSIISFVFICPNDPKVFYNIQNRDLISFIRTHNQLHALSVMILKIENDALTAISTCGHITNLILNVYQYDEFTDSSHFLTAVMNLLAEPCYKDCCFYKNFEPVGCFDSDSKRLTINSESCKIPSNFNQLLMHIFRGRRESLLALSLVDAKCITNKVMEVLVKMNGTILRDVILYACGKHITTKCLKFLANRSTSLKFVFVINGSKSLGSSGTCCLIGESTVLALLAKGGNFSGAYLEDIRHLMLEEDYCFLKLQYSQSFN